MSLMRISVRPFARGRDRRNALRVVHVGAAISRSAAFPYSYACAFARLAFAFAFAYVACGCGTPESAPTPTVEDLTYRRLPSGARIITGSVHNPSDEHVQNVQVQVSLFDASNARVGTMSILVQDIAAGESVTFREPVDSDFDVQAARVRSIIVM